MFPGQIFLIREGTFDKSNCHVRFELSQRQHSACACFSTQRVHTVSLSAIMNSTSFFLLASAASWGDFPQFVTFTICQ